MRLRIRRVFREQFDDDQLEIWDEMSTCDLPAWDSLMQVKLLIALEEEFGVQFTTAEAAEMRSVGDFLSALAAKPTLV
jgi:acyl carrier protein